MCNCNNLLTNKPNWIEGVKTLTELHLWLATQVTRVFFNGSYVLFLNSVEFQRGWLSVSRTPSFFVLAWVPHHRFQHLILWLTGTHLWEKLWRTDPVWNETHACICKYLQCRFFNYRHGHSIRQGLCSWFWTVDTPDFWIQCINFYILKIMHDTNWSTLHVNGGGGWHWDRSFQLRIEPHGWSSSAAILQLMTSQLGVHKVATQTFEQFHLHCWPCITETCATTLIASTGDDWIRIWTRWLHLSCPWVGEVAQAVGWAF